MCRAEIDQRLGLCGDETLVLVGLGGVSLRPQLILGRCCRVCAGWCRRIGAAPRADPLSWAPLEGLSMPDLIRSCDVLFTKPGYGAFTEAVCNGTPVL